MVVVVLTWTTIIATMMHGSISCIDTERRGLLELKAYIISVTNNSGILQEWDTNHTESDCCRWTRIKCDPTSKRVTGLFLGSSTFPDAEEVFTSTTRIMNLTLLYPFEELQSLNFSWASYGGWFDPVRGYKSLASFRKLEILDLASNGFNQTILPFLYAATSLKTLILRYNYFETGFPELRNLSNLEVLDLKANNFHGPLPRQELTSLQNLKILDLSDNIFSGSLQIQGICRMKNLQELSLSKNGFSGEIPLCFASFSKLRVLDLSSNQLVGKVPSFFGNFKSLEYMSLLGNNLEGLFSLGSIAELTKLKVFKLSSRSNMLQVVETNVSSGLKSQLSCLTLSHCNLGKIPGFLWYQKELRVIDLSGNMLSGVLPTWLLENNTELQVMLLQNNLFKTLTLPRQTHKLQFLDLSSNEFSYQFPVDIGQALPLLRHLNLSNNELQGNMPSSVARMEDLEFMDLSYNNFSGELPINLFTGCYSLYWLQLSHNSFGGPIVRKPTNRTSLATLIIDNNMFTGEIRDLRSLRELSVLDLSNNFLTGTIPYWLGNNSYMRVLRISNNRLHGAIPTSLFNIPDLWLLDLSGNRLSGSLPPRSSSTYGFILELNKNNLTGSIPDTFWEGLLLLNLRDNKLSGNIPRFKSTPGINVVLLRGNNLTGKIPVELCSLSKLRMLDIADNRLSGSIPSCLSNLSFGSGRLGQADSVWYPSHRSTFETVFAEVYYKSILVSDKFSFEYSVDLKVQVEFAVKKRFDSYMRGPLDSMFGLDLSSNELSGEIPQELGDLQRVRSLNLSRNSFSGSIPRRFSSLESIESLDLSFNKLHGTIPSQLSLLKYLVNFNVSYNNLSGFIPRGNQFHTFDETTYLGNVLLCGPPTNRSCGSTISSGEGEEDEEEDDDESGIVNMVVLWWSLSASYVTVLLGFCVFLCFDSWWRRSWFRFVDAVINWVGKSLLCFS